MVEVRLPREQQERWRAGAKERGHTLSDFIRACVEDVLAASGERRKPSQFPRPAMQEIGKSGDLGRRDVTPQFKKGAK